MKLIKLLKYFLFFITLTSYGQQKARPIFRLENRITSGSDTPQIHAMWEGMKNPLIITCNDPKIKFSIHATGGTILNLYMYNEFDLIPYQRDVQLFAIDTNNDTLYAETLISRKMIPPTFQLLLNKKAIGDNSTIYINSISLMSINILADNILKRDLTVLPIYKIDRVEINLNRAKKTILSVNSFSDLNSIKMNARSGDMLTIVVLSYSYTNGLEQSITTNTSRVFQLKVM